MAPKCKNRSISYEQIKISRNIGVDTSLDKVLCWSISKNDYDLKMNTAQVVN